MDAVVLLDGGSDSLMRGDEHGVGDLTEDAVGNDTIPAAATLDGDNDGIDNDDMMAAALTLHQTRELSLIRAQVSVAAVSALSIGIYKVQPSRTYLNVSRCLDVLILPQPPAVSHLHRGRNRQGQRCL